jgi:peroxiredoxin
MTPIARLALMSFAAVAGIKLYSVSMGQPHAASVPVPAGETSAPLPVDKLPAGGALPISAAVPQALPEFSLTDLHGSPTPISRWRGKSLVINFWATWCPPCRREIPLLSDLHSRLSAQGVEVIGVAVDEPEKVRAFAERLKIRYPLLVGEQDALDVAAALGVQSPVFPFTVFTDQRGRIVALFLGELKRQQVDIIVGVVDRLNHDRVNLLDARKMIAAAVNAKGADS